MKSHILALVFLISVVSSASSQPVWEKLHKESEGGSVEDIVVINGRVLMSTFSSLYESLDGGAHWNYVLNSNGLVVKPGGSPNRNFGADKKIIVSGDSIFFGDQFSPNGGISWQTWTVDGSTLPPRSAYSANQLTVLNIHKKELFLGTLYNGFFQSSDFGKTFVGKNNGLPEQWGYYFCPRAIEFYNDQPVIATTEGIYRWNGNTWINCTGTGLPKTMNGNYYEGYLIDRLRFLGSRWLANTNQGVFYSDDMGTNWNRYDAIPKLTNIDTWYNYSTPPVFYNLDVWNGVIYASFDSDIYISADSGTTWTHSQLPDKVQARRIATDGNYLLVATSGGIYKSLDDGITWQKSNSGFERTSYSIASENGVGFFYSFGGGILKSSDQDQTLSPFNTGLSLNHLNFVKGIGENDVFARVYRYYAYDGSQSTSSYELYRSSISTPQWTRMSNLPVKESSISSIVAASNGDYFITGVPVDKTYPTGLYRSQDKGQTWANIFSGITDNNIYYDYYEDAVTATLFDNDTIYAGTMFSGIYKSWDNGVTWTPFNEGLNIPNDKSSLSEESLWYVYAFEKQNNHIYFVGANFDFTYIYHSDDYGKHWSKLDLSSIDPSLKDKSMGQFSLTKDGVILTGVYTNDSYTESKIIISRDHGKTWAYYHPDFPETRVLSIGLVGDYLYASGYEGLYRTPAPTLPALAIQSVKGKPGELIDVPVKVRTFEDALSTQFSIAWDPTVISYKDIGNLAVSTMNGSNFGVTQVDQGILTFSWNDPSLIPQSFADTTLFSIRFRVIGFGGDSTALKISSTPLPLEVIDKNFNVISVKTTDGIVRVENPLITGRIVNTHQKPCDGVTVLLKGTNILTTTSEQNGFYSLELKSDSPSDNFVIQPSYDNPFDPVEEIDVADVAALRRHILQTELLNNPYALIAGDVDQNEHLSTLDILYIEALILGKINSFPDNTGWSFVPQEFLFANPNLLQSYPQSSNVSAVDAGLRSFDFIAIKHGDVNLSYGSDDVALGAGERATFNISQEQVTHDDAGGRQSIEIFVNAKRLQRASGFQFTLQWPHDKMEFINVSSMNSSVKFGLHNTINGELVVMWDDPNGKWTSLNDNDNIISLRFNTVDAGYRDLTVKESSGPVVYNHALEKISVDVTWGDEDKGIEVYPNPFGEKLAIGIHSKDGADVGIKIRDLTGKEIDVIPFQVNSGFNQLEWIPTDLKPGVYLIEIHTKQGVYRERVVRK